jgi:hypothetical protein
VSGFDQTFATDFDRLGYLPNLDPLHRSFPARSGAGFLLSPAQKKRPSAGGPLRLSDLGPADLGLQTWDFRLGTCAAGDSSVAAKLQGHRSSLSPALFRDVGWLDAHTLVGSERPSGAP